MSSQRNVYTNPLERAYDFTDNLRPWNPTFYTPIKG